MSPMVSKKKGKAHSRVNISQAAAVVGVKGLSASGPVFMGIGVLSTGLRVIKLLGQQGNSGWFDSKGVLKVTFFFNFFLSIVITTLMKALRA